MMMAMSMLTPLWMCIWYSGVGDDASSFSVPSWRTVEPTLLLPQCVQGRFEFYLIQSQASLLHRQLEQIQQHERAIPDDVA